MFPLQIKYFATYFIKQHAKRVKERKLDKSKQSLLCRYRVAQGIKNIFIIVRKEIAEAGQYPGTVITIPPINIASGKAVKQGYDNKVKVTDEDDIEPTYIVIKLKDQL